MFLLRLFGLARPKAIACMKTKEGILNGFAFPSGFRQYYCKDCNGPLHPGPEGCGSINAVCMVCKINHGCLALFWDRP